jgi:2-dehydropantoate 2-reductase
MKRRIEVGSGGGDRHLSRTIIIGAGAVGGVIGGRLALAGHDVVLVARGAHYEAIARDGLRLRNPDSDELVRVPVVRSVADLSIEASDTIYLGMKTQDCAPVLDQLASLAPPEVTIACAQNGIESERLALRFFAHVYGVYLYVYHAHLSPGVVDCHTAPCPGVIDLGRYPAGADARAEALASALVSAGFDSIARDDIMVWKRGKLVFNTGNAIGAVCATPGELADLMDRARQEAAACYDAASLPFAVASELIERGQALGAPTLVAGQPFPNGSTAQSLARGLVAAEGDYLNGEIVLLGRIHGVPTPVNLALQRLVRRAVDARAGEGTLSAAEVREAVAQAS